MDDGQKWWVVLNASGVKGKIPSNHVKVTGALDMRMRMTTPSPTSRQLSMAAQLLEQQGVGASTSPTDDGAAGRHVKRGSASAAGGAASSSAAAGVAYVLADYAAVREGELSIKKGEAITVVDDRKKWWVVQNDRGDSGKAPSNFFVMADNPYAVQGQVEIQIAAELAQLRSAANEQKRREADSSMAQAYADAQIRAREEIKRIAAIAFARANKHHSRIPTPSTAHAASPSPLSTVAASVDSDGGDSVASSSLMAPISAALSTSSASSAEPLRPTAQSPTRIPQTVSASNLAAEESELEATEAVEADAAAADAAATAAKSKPKRKAPKPQWRIDMEDKAKKEKAARRKQDKLRKELKNTVKDQQAMRRAKAEANKLLIKENTRNLVSQAFAPPPPPPENLDDYSFVGMEGTAKEEEDAMRWNATGTTVNPAFLETGRLRRADSGQVARAVREYIAKGPNEVSILQDELVIVLDDREAYWIVRAIDGDGKVPENVFELDGESPDRPISGSTSPVVDLPEVTWGSRTQTPTAAGATPNSTDDEGDEVVISGEIGRFWELTELARSRGEAAAAAVAAAGDLGGTMPKLPLPE